MEPVKVTPGPYDPTGSYAKVMTSVVREENPEASPQEVEDIVKGRWKLWVKDQGGETDMQQARSSDAPSKTVQDYGFARTPKHSFFPATREKHCKRSDRIKVIFLATGTTAFVPEKDWQGYSAEAAATLKQNKEANRGGFSTALKILESRIASLSGGDIEAFDDGACTVLAQQPRKLGALSNPKLTTEKIFNNAAFASKMYLKENRQWGCHQCPAFQAELSLTIKTR